MASEQRLYIISDDTKAKLRKFRLGTSRAKDPQAVIYQIDKKSLEISQADDEVYTKMTDLADELPDNSPRFVLLSYPLTLASGRISVPYVMLNYLPPTCSSEMRMLYAGAKEFLRNQSEVGRIIEIDSTDDLEEIEEEVVFVADDLWVPLSVVNGNVHILPGIPRLFEKMLTGLKPTLLPRLVDPEGKGVYRILFSTPLPESGVADYLTELSSKVEGKGVKVGSYPRWGKSRNTVTLVGRDKEFMESLVPEVEKGVQGRRVQQEGEDDDEKSDQDT